MKKGGVWQKRLREQVAQRKAVIGLTAAVAVVLVVWGLSGGGLLSDEWEGGSAPPPGTIYVNRKAQKQLTAALIRANIIQDVLDGVNVENTGEFSLHYGDKEVTQGTKILPAEAKLHPTVKISGKGLYTLILVDPDAPSPNNPSMREWLHWMVVNIPDGDLAKGQEILAYTAPTPPVGVHRYVAMLIIQPKGLAVPVPKQRGSFKTREFLSKQGLGVPIRVVWFTAAKASEQ